MELDIPDHNDKGDTQYININAQYVQRKNDWNEFNFIWHLRRDIWSCLKVLREENLEVQFDSG